MRSYFTSYAKLRSVKYAFRFWNKQVFGYVNTHTDKAFAVVQHASSWYLLKWFTKARFNLEVKSQDDLDLLFEKQDLMFKEKCQTSWLKHGDKNIYFFHNAPHAWEVNTLFSSLLIDNQLVIDKDVIGTHVDQFY